MLLNTLYKVFAKALQLRLKLDFSKAYNRVDVDFLFRTLTCMGFLNSFVVMTKLQLTDANTCVNVNGRSTKKFEIQEGVRQGCPIVPYLFLIIGEILNESIKREVAVGNIRGISMPGLDEQQILSQYADDSSLMLRGEEASTMQTLSTLNTFSKVTGLLINQKKSSTYWWS